MSRLQKLCEKYQFISFDIFDTLVKRTTRYPKEVFDLVQEKYIAKYGVDQAIANYASVRIHAERTARNRKQGEITLDEIYDVIAEDRKDDISEKYKVLEIECEIRCCIPYKKIKSIYDHCIATGKKIYIVSDMYLPKDVIQRILNECGYTGYQKLYLSCITGK